jgi:hypothetical protein
VGPIYRVRNRPKRLIDGTLVAGGARGHSFALFPTCKKKLELNQRANAQTQISESDVNVFLCMTRVTRHAQVHTAHLWDGSHYCSLVYYGWSASPAALLVARIFVHAHHGCSPKLFRPAHPLLHTRYALLASFLQTTLGHGPV